MTHCVDLAFTVSFDKTLYSLPKGWTLRFCKKSGFTLAETLITLTIIGVIAAMTVPTLMTNYQKHAHFVALKKAYSQLQNAVKQMPLTEGCSAGDYECVYPRSTYDQGGMIATEILSRQFKVAKIFLNEYSQAGSLCKHMGWYSCFQTDDGMIFSASQGWILVDTNGLKGPNKNGYDLFQFSAPLLNPYRTDITIGYLDQVIPRGAKLEEKIGGTYWKDNQSCLKFNSSIGAFCTGRVFEENGIKY